MYRGIKQGKPFNWGDSVFEVLIQLQLSKLRRIPEVIYMGSQHLYDAIVVRALCWDAVMYL